VKARYCTPSGAPEMTPPPHYGRSLFLAFLQRQTLFSFKIKNTHALFVNSINLPSPVYSRILILMHFCLGFISVKLVGRETGVCLRLGSVCGVQTDNIEKKEDKNA